MAYSTIRPRDAAISGSVGSISRTAIWTLLRLGFQIRGSNRVYGFVYYAPQIVLVILLTLLGKPKAAQHVMSFILGGLISDVPVRFWGDKELEVI